MTSALPDSPKNATDLLSHAERFTRRLALSHYENFVVGGLLTPRRLRQDFYNVYAYCRLADDLADEVGDEQESLRRLDQWETWLRRCHTGQRVDHPVFVALRSTIAKFDIPIEPFLELLVAFRTDQQTKSYDNFSSLRWYCQHSADPVGHIVLHLGHCFNETTARLADHVCTGLQLANFCQDVRRDAERGRIYLPTEELQAFAIPPQTLSQASPPPGAREMLAAQVARAEESLRHGLPLVNHVPRWLARNVRLFVGGGLAILGSIRRADYDVWTRRPIVSRKQRARLIVNAWMGG